MCVDLDILLVAFVCGCFFSCRKDIPLDSAVLEAKKPLPFFIFKYVVDISPHRKKG